MTDHDDLVWLGIKEEEVFIEYRPTGIKMALPVTTILGFEWVELEAVLTLKRMARLLKHFTRIVGYFSSTHNWNRSKVAELVDRRKGEYRVSDPEPVGDMDVKNEEAPARVAVAHA